MRVLTITKRRSSGKDLIADRFGRYYHLPMGISRLASESMVIAADYEVSPGSTLTESSCTFVSIPFTVSRFPAYLRTVTSAASDFGPDIVFAGGDIQFGWVGRRVARHLDVPFVFDVFDNYEAFASARLPGTKRMFQSAVAAADLTVVVSERLFDLLDAPKRRTVVPNGVDLDLFRPAPVKLGGDGATITYVGALAHDRGVSTLIEAAGMLRSTVPEVKLKLVGPIHGEFRVPSAEWIDYLGFIEQDRIPGLLWESDVAVLPYPVTKWASYTSPYKLREYLACEVPVVVTDISTYSTEVAAPESVCQPGDPRDMARAIAFQLDNRVIVPRSASWSWAARAAELHREFEELTSSNPSGE